ncbi:MAG: hypothetical protein WA840_22935 [Caulobacteraceae bacterium]
MTNVVRLPPPEVIARKRLRAWLEHVAQLAIDWLDELDAAEVDLEDDEREASE